ncbi:hypothetical protein OSB04_029321 [Centaurea solstitialis]|uniref:Reverse transcriptase domain-containing protein n=1 Tax=Centaurea solstitialis TaxID=347529 RepID=A0AA38SUW3_9ASTR|nr:hypothetical protein OSB04_029321 [Centaurea solstitialis]
MPFGLCNAPATFMRLMNNILRPHIDDFVIVYLDDILIYSHTEEEHLEHLKKKNLVYLGFMVGGGNLQVDPEKIKAIKDWSILSCVTEVRSFMGACQYLRNYSITVTCSKLNAKFEWTSKHEDTFLLLKRKISEAPVLALPNLQRPFELETDVSAYAMGVVLLQEGKPVAYHSEMFQGAQRNYRTYDKELFALHQAVKHWRCYLLGNETIVHTDHQPLQYLQSQAKLQQARHMKWMTYLQQFNIVIKYKKGVHNRLADMLSRPPISSLCLSVFMQVQPICHDEYVEEYENDSNFQRVVSDIKSRRPSEFTWKGSLTLHSEKWRSSSMDARSPYFQSSRAFRVTKTLQNLQRYVFWPQMHQDIVRFVKGCMLCSTSKPTNRKVGLYTLLSVPTRPWESI